MTAARRLAAIFADAVGLWGCIEPLPVARILLPERRGRSVAIDLGGELEHTAASPARATTAVLQSAVDGAISAEEAQQLNE
jgi:hypothetical protein